MFADHQHLPVAGDARGLGDLRVGAGAGREQRAEHAEVVLQHGGVQRGVAGRRRVGVGALGQQELDQCAVTAVRRDEQRTAAVRGGVVDVGAGRQQQARRVDGSLARGEEQRGVAAEVGLLGVGAVAPARARRSGDSTAAAG